MYNFTAYKDGKVSHRGTFDDLELLKIDYPSPEYTLVLNELHAFPEKVETYVEKRQMAYPPLQDLADALYWQAQGDDSRMKTYMARVEAVKGQFPKE